MLTHRFPLGGFLTELLTSGGWQPQLPSSPAELAESGEFWMLAAAQAMALGTIMVCRAGIGTALAVKRWATCSAACISCLVGHVNC